MADRGRSSVVRRDSKVLMLTVFSRQVSRKLFGPRWNEAVTSIAISSDAMADRVFNSSTEFNQVFDSVTQLKRIQTLGFLRLELSESQIARLAKMKSLQWLYLVDTNVDQATLDSLRKELSNTFVTGVSDADAG